MDTNRAELRTPMQVLVMVVVLAGCGATSGNGPALTQSNGGGGGTSGGGSGGAGNIVEAGGVGAAGGAGAPSSCPGPSPAPIAATGHIELPIRITVNQAPMTIGAPAAGRSGLEYKLSAFELFLAEPALVDQNGGEAKAQIVGPDGKPLAYGLQLVNADDPTTQTLRLAVQPGSYSALKLGVGVPADCNATSSTSAVYPLNPDGQMFWSWGSQFLFIRIEGATRTPPATDFTTFFHHVGYDPAYTHVTVPGALSVATSGVGPTLNVDVDRLLAGGDGSTIPVPSGSHGVPDGWVVDNLETQQVFTLQ
jgi:hypothetical protein